MAILIHSVFLTKSIYGHGTVSYLWCEDAKAMSSKDDGHFWASAFLCPLSLLLSFFSSAFLSSATPIFSPFLFLFSLSLPLSSIHSLLHSPLISSLLFSCISFSLPLSSFVHFLFLSLCLCVSLALSLSVCLCLSPLVIFHAAYSAHRERNTQPLLIATASYFPPFPARRRCLWYQSNLCCSSLSPTPTTSPEVTSFS